MKFTDDELDFIHHCLNVAKETFKTDREMLERNHGTPDGDVRAARMFKDQERQCDNLQRRIDARS